MAFTPDGALLYTEKCRGLSVRRVDGSVRRLFGEAGNAVVAADFYCRGQSGMLGVAVDPQFPSNRYIYVHMQSNLSSPSTNRVVRLRLDSAYTSVGDRADIVADLSFKAAVNAHGAVGMQSGGRIRFGPDGLLYITTGDNHSGSLPQDLARLGGKVVRVDRNGAAAPGNNPPGGDARIFTFGHRNPQGIAFRPVNGRPYLCEHGPRHTDEVTALTAGGNGGWDPRNRPGIECADGYCGYDGDPQSMPMTDTGRFPNALRPLWTNGGRSQGTGPCTFLNGSQWRDWNGRLAVGVMAGRRISILQLDAAGTALVGESTASVPAVRYRALVQGPDGDLYAMTDGVGGEIWRLSPQ
jgi:glucose/arabinose dehydrogenase